MCDCFHLPFPNWQGSPGAGAGRRLRGPEPEDDSVCEDPPEFLEGERPRPQGSSPVNEYPVTEKYTDIDKQREEEIYDPYQKSSGSKKGRKVGFGSFFEKRSSAKMSQEESPESGVIVKTAKEACAEGLVVSGGGREGIFIKEVKAESLAAKHLNVQEGDQILSATVYFDNVSYEDALQILEHAQPYKMEFCLKRKPLGPSALESSTAERQEVAPGEEGASSANRERVKTQRRNDARISWPKFPSFTRGRKAHFKRSHSTSEAEEQRKLEMSPTTSDTESPIKSQEAVKDRTKKQKIKLSKLKMKGLKSKSVEHQDKDSVPVSRSLENVKTQQADGVSGMHPQQKKESMPGETPQIYVLDEPEKKETMRIRNEYTFPDVTGSETEISQHRAELISLDNTLKTTDISDFLIDRGRVSTKRSPEVKKKKKKERSELKVNIQGKEKEASTPESLLKSPKTLILKTSSDSLNTPETGARAQDPSGNIMSPNVISQTELKGRQIAIDINTQRIDQNKSISKVGKESSEKKVISTTTVIGDMDICLPKVDVSLDMSDVGLLKKSPKKEFEKHKKERSILILDSERYGIRPRGPMSDISTTKTYLGGSGNGPNLSSSDGSKPRSPKMITSLPSIKAQDIAANAKDASLKMETVVDIQTPQLEIQASKPTTETNIDDGIGETGTRSLPKFKMPKIELPDFNVHEPIVMTEVEASKTKAEVKGPKDKMHKAELDSRKPSTTKQTDITIELLKREDIEIPGMETITAGNIQTPAIKLPEIRKTDATVPTVEFQAKKILIVMKADDIKEAKSKIDIPTFKLPKVGISGLDVHQQIKKSDVTEKVKLDLTADVSQPGSPGIRAKGQDIDAATVPMIQTTNVTTPDITDSHLTSSEHSTETRIHSTTEEMSKRIIPMYKLPKTEPLDLDEHELISMAQVSFSKTEVQVSKIEGKLPKAEVAGGTLKISTSNFETDKAEKPEIKLPKLPKREDIDIPGMEANIQMTAIKLPEITKKDTSVPSVEIQAKQIQPETHADNIKEAISNVKLPTFRLPKIGISGIDVHEQIIKTDVNTEMAKYPKSDGKDQILHTDIKCKNIISEDKFKIPPMPDFDVSFPNLKADVKLNEKPGKERETGEMKFISDTQVIAAGSDIDADFKSSLTELSQINDLKGELGTAAINTQVSDKKPKKSKQNVLMPTFGITKPDIRFPEAEVQISLQKGKVDIKLPELDKASEIEANTSDSQSIKIAQICLSTPTKEVEALNASLDIDVTKGSVPLAGVDTELCDVSIKGQNIETEIPEWKMGLQKVRTPDSSLSKHKAASDFGISSSIVKAEIVSGAIHLSPVNISTVEKTDLKIKGPEISADETSLGMKLPELELSGKTPVICIKDPGVAVGRSVDNVNVAGEIIQQKRQGVKLPKSEISFSNLKRPTVEISKSKPGIDVLFSEAEVDAKLSSVEVKKLPAEEKFKMPDIDFREVDLKVKDPTISVPKVKAETPDVKQMKTPSLEISRLEKKSPEFTGHIIIPSAKVSLTKPDTVIVGPEISAGGTSVDVKVPELKMSTATASAGIKITSVEVEGLPANVDTDGKGVELEKQGSKFKVPTFGIPSLKEKGSGVDISTLKPDVDISLSERKIDAQLSSLEVERPSVEGKLKKPATDIKGIDLTVMKPQASVQKFRKSPKVTKSTPEVTGVVTIPELEIQSGKVGTEAPEIDIKGPKVELVKAEDNIDLPKVKMSDITVALPKIKDPTIDLKLTQVKSKKIISKTEVDIKAPDVDISEETKRKFEMPRMKKPSFGISKPELKGSTSDADVSISKPDNIIKGPEISGSGMLIDVNVLKYEPTVPRETLAVDVESHCVDIGSPQVDVEMDKKVETEGQESRFKLPKVMLPKVKRPALDINTSKPNADISLPEVDVEATLPTVEFKGLSVEGKAEISDIDAKGVDVKVKKPKISLPKFGFSKSEIKTPEIDVSLPKGDVSPTKKTMDVQGPEMDIKASEIHAEIKEKPMDISGSPTTFKLPTIKFPKVGISGSKSKTETSDVNTGIIAPELKTPSNKERVDIEVPDIHIDGRSELDKPNSKTELLKMKIPDIDVSLPKVKDQEVSLKTPKAEIDISVPVSEIGSESPSLGNVTAEIESGGKAKYHMPHIKMPSFGISKFELKGPKASDMSLPEFSLKKQDMHVKGPEVSIDGISIDTNTQEPKLTLSGKTPAVDVKGTDVDINMKGTEGDLKALSLEGQATIPDNETGAGQRGQFKMPHIKMPSFGFSKPEISGPKISEEIHLPSVEMSSTKPNTDINIPDTSADLPSVGVKLKKPELSVSGETPAVDIKGSDVDIDMKGKKVELEGQGSKFKLPKFGISFPKVPGSGVDISTSKPDVDISLPEVTAEAHLPGVEVKGPSVEGKLDKPDVNSTEVDVKVKKPSISFPKLGFSKPHIKAAEIEVSLPEGGILEKEMVDVKNPEIDIKSTETEANVDVEIGGSPSKFKLPSIKLPKFRTTAPKIKADLPEVSAEITVPEIEVSSGKIDIDHDGPGMDIEKQEGKFELPKVKMPKIDFSLSKPKEAQLQEIHKTESEVCASETDIVTKESKVSLKGPSLDGKAEIPEIEAGTGQHGKFKMPHIKMPSFGFSKHEISGPNISGEVHLSSVDISATKPDTDINVPDTSADLTSVGVKLKKPELSVSGEKTAVDIKGPDVDIDMKGKEVERQEQGSKFKLPQFGISFPKVKGSGVDISTSKPDVDISLPELTAEAHLPGVEVKGPSVEGKLDTPEVNSTEVDVKVKKPSISFPKFGFSKPDIKAAKIEVSLPEGGISKKEMADVKAPEIDIKSTETEAKVDVDIGGSPSKFKLPSIKLPTFGTTAPKIKADLPEVSAEITVPKIEASSGKVDIDHYGPGMDIEKQEGKFELPKVKMPKIDFSLSKPKEAQLQEIHKAESEVCASETDIVTKESKVSLKGPSLDGKAEIPEIEAGTGQHGKFKMPHIKMPSFGFSKAEISGPKMSGEVHLPSVDISVTKPDTGIKVPDISADLPSGGIKLKKPELSVSGETPAVDIKSPDVDITIKGKEVEQEGQGSKFKLPKFGISFPKVKEPEVDISASKPNVDISLPEVTVEVQLPGVELEGPSVEKKVDIPEVDTKEVDIKLKKPRISFPKFGFSKPDVKSPEIDISLPKVDISLTEGSVEVKEPEVDIKAPDVEAKEDADIKGSPSKFKLPTFKLPKFGTTAPKVKAEAPGFSGDITVPEIEASTGKVDIDHDGPGMDIEKPDGTFEWPKLKMPDIDFSLPKTKRIEINQEIPKAELNISVPNTDIVLQESALELKEPSLDGQAEIPDIEVGPEQHGKFKMPHLKMPSFGFSKPEISGPKTSGDINLPSVDISVTTPGTGIKVPDISADVPSDGVKLSKPELLVSRETPTVDIKGYSVDVEGPDVDIDLKDKSIELEGQGSKFKLPKFGISLPKAKRPVVDISASKPDVHVSLPEVTVEAKLPGVEVDGSAVEGKKDIPEVEVKEADLKVKKPRISFPKFGFSKPEIKSPETDVNLPKGDVSFTEGSVEVKGPEVDIKAPEIQIETKDKGMDIVGSPTKFKLPTFKMPKFGISAPKVTAETPIVNTDIKEPEIETSSRKLKVVVGAPIADIVGSSIELDKTKGKLELSKMNMPDIDVSLPKVKGSGINLTTPKAEADISVSKPEIDIESSPLYVTAEMPVVKGRGKAKFELPQIKMPSFGISQPELKGAMTTGDMSMPSADISVTKPEITIKIPEIRADGTSQEIKPQLTLSGKTPTVDIKGPDVDVDGLSINVDMKGKEVELDGQGSKVKLPKFGISFPKMKESGVEIRASRPDAGTSLPEEKIQVKLPDMKVEGSTIEGKGEITEVAVKDSEVKMKRSKISFPKFGFSKPDIKAPEIDINLPKVDTSLSDTMVDVKAPDIDIKSTEAEANVDVDIGGSPSKFKLPSIKLPKFGMTISKVKADLPEVSVDITEPQLEVSSGKVDIDYNGPGMDIEKPEGKFELPKLNMPDIDFSLPKTKEIEIHQEIPKAESSLSEPKLKLKGPSLDGQAEISDIEVGTGQHGKFKMPHIKMPSFGFSKAEISGPKMSGEVHLPSVDISVTKPDTGIKVPDISADLPSGGIKLKEPELSVSGETPAVDIKSPDVDITMKGKEVEQEGQGSKFKLPKFGISFPKTKGPGVDISASKPDVDISLPEMTVEAQLPGAEVEGPSTEGKVDMPEKDAKEVDLKAKKSRISFLKFGFSKPDVKTPEIDISLPKEDISLKERSVEVKEPEVDSKATETEIEIKDKDMDIIGSPTKFKLPTFKFPRFGISATKVTAEPSNINTDITVPEIEASSKQYKVDVEAPTVEIDGSSLELDKSKGKIELPKIKMPDIDVSLVKPKGSGINLKTHKAEADMLKPEMDIESSCFDETIKISETETGGKGKFQFPHIKMPSFGISKPEQKDSTISGDIHLPSVSLTKPDTNIKGQDIDMDGMSVQVKLSEPELAISGETNLTDIKDPSIDFDGPSFDATMKEAEPEGQGSTFKLPKFGISFPKVKETAVDVSSSKPDVNISLPGATVETQLLSVELERPSMEGTIDIPEVDSKEVDLKVKKSRISFPKFGFSKQDVKAPELDVSLPKIDISLTEGSVEVKGPEVDIKAPETQIEIKDKDMDIVGSPTKFKLLSFKFPKFGTVAPKSKIEAQDVSADITVPEIEASLGKVGLDAGAPDFKTDVLSIEIDKPEGIVKLPELKADMSATTSHESTDLSQMEGPALEVKVDNSAPEPIKTEVETKGSPSKFKLPTFKMPRFGFSTAKAKSSDIDLDTEDTGLKTPEVTFERTTLEIYKTNDGTSDVPGTEKTSELQVDTKGPKKSSKFNLSTIEDVFKGLDIEFNVPTLEEEDAPLASSREDIAHTGAKEQSTHSTSAEKDSKLKYKSNTDPSEIQLSTSHPGPEVSIQALTITKETEAKERSKFKFRFPKLGFTESSEQGGNTESTNVVVEEKERELEPQEEKETENITETATNTDKGTWFKLPKFGSTSPSKTIKDSDKKMGQPSEGISKSVEGDIVEEEVSVASSVRSSDAFADISSTMTSEQAGPSIVSPTKVKVKISEPIAMVGVGEVKVPSNIITSTARTELILLEPHLPEKIDTAHVPVSAGAIFPFPDELKQEPGGDIHVVTSNIQATPSSEHAKVITKFETHSMQAMQGFDSKSSLTVKVSSAPWTIEGPGERLGKFSEEKILVEKHLEKEKSVEDKGTVIITRRVTQIVEADSGEPVLEDAASAIKKLRDTMHSEKMKFFEDAETSTVTVSTHKIETHVFDTSTEKK